jgi:hypothetical protein
LRINPSSKDFAPFKRSLTVNLTGLFAFWLQGRTWFKPLFERRDSAADARFIVRPAGISHWINGLGNWEGYGVILPEGI